MHQPAAATGIGLNQETYDDEPYHLGEFGAAPTRGYAQDARFAPLVQRVLDRQDTQGRWLCSTVSCI